MQAAAVHEPQSAFLKDPELVLAVKYTGIRRGRFSHQFLYVPPLTLKECLTRILESLNTDPWNAGLVRANPDREPPIYRDAAILHSAAKGETRWPLVYITAEVGRIDLPALRQAFREMGGQLD